MSDYLFQCENCDQDYSAEDAIKHPTLPRSYCSQECLNEVLDKENAYKYNDHSDFDYSMNW